MSDPNEVPVPNGKRLMPSNSTMIGAAGGIGLAPIIVWAVETFTHVPVPALIAASIGAVIAKIAGYPFEGGRKV